MAEPTSPAEQPTQPARHGWSRKTKLVLVGILLLPVILFSIYTMAAMSWSYSEGWRSGIVQKFSKKGYVCKTWEGELAMTTVPGVAPTLWLFSVRDDRVAGQINEAIGNRVDLHYQEKRGIPTDCFGSTDYWVDSIRVK